MFSHTFPIPVKTDGWPAEPVTQTFLAEIDHEGECLAERVPVVVTVIPPLVGIGRTENADCDPMAQWTIIVREPSYGEWFATITLPAAIGVPLFGKEIAVVHSPGNSARVCVSEVNATWPTCYMKCEGIGTPPAAFWQKLPTPSPNPSPSSASASTAPPQPSPAQGQRLRGR